MTIRISDELKKYLDTKKKKNIVVEVATTDTSDFDVSEIFIRLCDHKHRDYLKGKKGYREYPIENVDIDDHSVLIKPYVMHISDEVSFDLKKYWIFNKIVYSGIKL